MASALTVTEFYTKFDALTKGKSGSLTPAQKIEFLNDAIVNKFTELKNLVRSVYEGRVALPFTSNGYTVALPSDMLKDEVLGGYELYSDDSYGENGIMGGKDEQFFMDGDDLRFADSQLSGYTTYIRYTKEENQYTDVSDTILETVSTRALRILLHEVEGIVESAQYRGQAPASYQVSKTKSNDLYGQ